MSEGGGGGPGALRRAWASARRVAGMQVAPPAWDRLLWATGLLGLVGIATVELVPPLSAAAAFVAITLLTNGPWSPLLPVAYEPAVVAFGRLQDPLVVAALGTSGALLVEVVNLRVYDAILASRRLARARGSRVVRGVVAVFRRWPAGAVLVCAMTPVPFWIARVCAVLERYPRGRYLAIMAAGRFPHVLAFALVGAGVPRATGPVVIGGALLTVIAAPVLWWRARRARDPAADPSGLGLA